MTTTTGHEIEIDTQRGYAVISGDESTAMDIPQAEIDAACAAAGVRCTYESVDEMTYRVVPTAPLFARASLASESGIK